MLLGGTGKKTNQEKSHSVEQKSSPILLPTGSQPTLAKRASSASMFST